MIEYINYVFNVAKKPLLIWLFAPGLYMMILPLSFSGGALTKMVEAKKIALDDTMGENELFLRLIESLLNSLL